MSNTYTVKTTRGTLLSNILEEQRYVLTDSVILHGRGAKNYHLDRNQNLVYLLENFAGSPAPTLPHDGQLWWDIQNQNLMVYDTLAGSPQGSGSPWHTVVPPGQGVGFTIAAGQGLVYNPVGSPADTLVQSRQPSGSPLTIELQVNAGTGISLTANTVNMDPFTIDHDQVTGGLTSITNQHIDHSSVTVTGSGITGGGDLTTSRTLAVNDGDGITANANNIQVDSTVVRTTGDTWGGNKTFTTAGSIRVTDGTVGAPAYSFSGDTDTGMYRSGTNELSFSTGGTQRFRIESNGVLRSLNTTYETLVTEDDDIPNKKYVDDASGSLGTVTENTFVSSTTSAVVNLSISGLTPGKKYLVSVYGILREGPTGFNTFGSVRVTSGAGPTTGVLWAGPAISGINWPDGNFIQHAVTVITAPAGGIIYGWTDYVTASIWQNARKMTAVQLN